MTGPQDTGLAGRCVIVTGAARGQGAAHARALAAGGARVVLTDVLDELGTQVAKEIGDGARYVHLDVTSESEWASAVQAAISTFGLVRVLVNNAGVLIRGSLEAGTVANWDLTFAVNVRGAWLGMRAVLDSMREASDAGRRRGQYPAGWWIARGGSGRGSRFVRVMTGPGTRPAGIGYPAEP